MELVFGGRDMWVWGRVVGVGFVGIDTILYDHTDNTSFHFNLRNCVDKYGLLQVQIITIFFSLFSFFFLLSLFLEHKWNVLFSLSKIVQSHQDTKQIWSL